MFKQNGTGLIANSTMTAGCASGQREDEDMTESVNETRDIVCDPGPRPCGGPGGGPGANRRGRFRWRRRI
eukprot:149197-Hanusia_phi.AAC.5